MSSKKEEIKESINKAKDTTDKNLEQQKQLVKDTTSNITETTDNIDENVNRFLRESPRIFEKNTETFRKFQEQIIKGTQEISNNVAELQKNFFNTYQSSYNQFLDNTYRSYWQNFNIPERYSESYNRVNKNIQDGTNNLTNFINEITVGGIEHYSHSLELTQRYYNDILQNNFNYAKKIERSYSR
ncbi:MAG: hypothetical protein MRJ93_03410 [Nitrososphaeraceae archaeon]|nr:hypothetical protein [Nitrososphaeraceae archaeon]